MQRRTLLIRCWQAIVGALTAVILVPIARFVTAPLLKKEAKASSAQRVAKLSQLKVGVPQQFPIIGNRQDGWTLYPQAVIGKVWLVRKTEEATDPAKVEVDVFSAVCPHLGCGINHKKEENQFICPCHEAIFKTDGTVGVLEGKAGYVNPSPRGMDTLESHIVQAEGSDDMWIEVEYQKFKIGLKEKAST